MHSIFDFFTNFEVIVFLVIFDYRIAFSPPRIALPRIDKKWISFTWSYTSEQAISGLTMETQAVFP